MFVPWGLCPTPGTATVPWARSSLRLASKLKWLGPEAEAPRDGAEEELISFPQRLHSDPIGASASLGGFRRPALVSHFLSNFCKMVWPKLSGVVQKLMDERVQEAIS